MHMRRPSSPRIEPVPEAAAEAREQIGGSRPGPVNATATFAHNKIVLDALGRCQRTIFNEGAVAPRQRELAILRMGWNCQAVYEFGQHTLYCRQFGVREDEIWFTTRPLSEGSWAPADRAVLQLVDDLYTDDCVSDATWDETAHHFTTAQIIELVAVSGLYRLVSGLMNTCGVTADEGVPSWPQFLA